MTRSHGYLYSCGAGRSIIGTGGCLESEGTIGAKGGVYSLEWPVDGVDGLPGAESLIGAKDLVGAEAPKVVLDEALGTVSEALALWFSVPRDSVSICGPAHLDLWSCPLDFCSSPVPDVPGQSWERSFTPMMLRLLTS